MNGTCLIEDDMAYYLGYWKQRNNSVAFIVRKIRTRAVFGYTATNDQIILIRLHGQPFNMLIIEVCLPKTDAEQEEVNKFYGQIVIWIFNSTCKQNVVLMYTGLRKLENLRKKIELDSIA